MAAAWCLLALLATVLLPAVHGVEIGWGHGHDAIAGEHAHCSHHEHEDPAESDDGPVEHDHEDGCPVCQVIHLAGAGGLPVFGLQVDITGAAVQRAVIALRDRPCRAEALPQLTRRGPPAA